MYPFIYRTIRRHGYADVTIPHRSTSKNPITLLNFPYIGYIPTSNRILPGRLRGRRGRILWVGLSCQSVRVASRA